MPRTLRIALSCALIGIPLLWLATEPPPTKKRWGKLSAEFEKGTIGHLPPEQSKLLNDSVRLLLPFAGVSGPVRVNRSPMPGTALHIYTTTPAAFEATGCARGNAIYDSRIDTVFIDQDLFAPVGLESLGEDSPTSLIGLRDLTFLPPLLRFVLSHELGHRSKHGSSGGLFDFNLGSPKEEMEADQFALQTMIGAYARELKAGGQNLGPSAAELLFMDDVPLSASERVWVDLIGGTASAMNWYLYSSSNFSPFYHDQAHPTFLTRSLDILQKARLSKATSPMLKAHAAFQHSNLVRMIRFGRGKFAEIQLPYGFQYAAFGDQGLAILTNGGHIFFLPLSELKEAISSGGGRILLSKPILSETPTQNNAIEESVVTRDTAWASVIWGDLPHGFLRSVANFDNGRAISIESLRLNAQAISRPNQNLTKAISDISYIPESFTPPQPSGLALLASQFPDPDESIAIVRKHPSAVKWSTLKQSVLQKSHLKSISLDFGTVTANTAYFSVRDSSQSHSRLYGVAELDLDSASVSKVVPLRFEYEGGGDAPGLLSDIIVVVPSKRQPRYFLVSRSRDHMNLFELSTTQPMHLFAQHPFIIDDVMGSGADRGARAEGLGAFDPELKNAFWVPPNFLVSVFKNDSVYSTDLNTGTTRILFTPGLDVEAAVSNEGYVSISVSNGRKVYVVLPGS